MELTTLKNWVEPGDEASICPTPLEWLMDDCAALSSIPNLAWVSLLSRTQLSFRRHFVEYHVILPQCISHKSFRHAFLNDCYLELSIKVSELTVLG